MISSIVRRQPIQVLFSSYLQISLQGLGTGINLVYEWMINKFQEAFVAGKARRRHHTLIRRRYLLFFNLKGPVDIKTEMYVTFHPFPGSSGDELLFDQTL